MEYFYLKKQEKNSGSTFSLKFLLFVLFPVLISGLINPAFCQSQQKAEGIVIDNNGKPLEGVLVKAKNSGSSVVTDADGKFNILSAANEELVFNHPNFYIRSIKNKAAKAFTVRLNNRYLSSRIGKLQSTDSAVVAASKQYVEVLHGRQPLETLIQSIGSVNNNQLITTPSSNFLQAIPGRIAGLDITFNNGAPSIDAAGTWFSVRNSRGGNVVLIDGVQRNFLSINPEQVESISVLRDALSTVMFGQRSSGGIVSITTKKGDSGTPRLSFTAQTALQSPTVLPRPLNAWQYATLYNEARKNDGNTASYSSDDIYKYYEGNDPYGHPNVDWYNTVLKDQALMSRYNFNVQGNGTGFRYYVDADYMNENGLLKTIDENQYNTNAQLKRYIMRSNLGVDITKSTAIQINLLGRIQRNNEPGAGVSGIFNSMYNTPRGAYPVFNADGSLAGNSQYTYNTNIYGQSLKRGYRFTDARDLAVDVQLTQKLDILTSGLYFKVQGSYNNSSSYLTTRAKNFAVFQANGNGGYTNFLPSGTNTNQTSVGAAGVRSRVTYWEGALGYEKKIGDHNLGAMLVANQQSTMLYSSGHLPENYTDFAGRLTYDWKGKYLAEAAGSYAGYNRLAPGKRWGLYWAGGLGWNVHKEDFVQNNLNFISNLKLRANYGKTGFANTGYYTYLQTYTSATSNHSYYWWGENSSVIQSIYEGGLTNPELEAEKANKLNLGVDLGLWDNKLSFTGDYYINKFYNMVTTPERQTNIIGIDGYPTQNIAKYDISGWDLSATWQNRVSNFSYFIIANFSVVDSKIRYVGELPKEYEWQRLTGKTLGVKEGYVATGLWQSYDEINDPANAILSGTSRSLIRPGDIRYLDRNSDGTIDNDDRGDIGHGKPVMYYGATLGFNYKSFDFNMHVYGTGNRTADINTEAYRAFGNSGMGNAFEYNLGRWTPETASKATQPRAWIGNNVNNTQTSTYWIKNANFWRLKNAEFGYALPNAVSKKIGLPYVRLFMNGQNLLTFSELFKVRDDIDPEALGGAYPVMRSVNFGVNVKF
ncbi:SusC/RagA family TonB-linked outer membrane protein [Desertivirga xinjiangensis]|uniref:SusC/RagA family TonB-linked outer membrane protein n=1 Tax=Desertivirga xinjiangensis TaxID=539206 RepID=UPI00210EF2DC|nr:SusC/RagA family TonB-linked outer membrane protein [Pedobacter xinjiangensis]